MSGPFDEVFAQPTAVRILGRALETGRIAASYLFEGPSGVGKERAALAFAEALVATDEPSRRRIRAGSHPDVRLFRPRDEGHRNVQVDYLRSEILPVAQFAPFESERAFLIFPEADVSFPEQHPESANAILKTLEEPRAGVHFILLSERPDRLLPTIRSRCQSVRFSRLPAEVLKRILTEHGVTPEGRDLAIALANGRADRALEAAQGGQSKELLERAVRLDAVLRTRKPGSLVAMSEQLGRTDLRLVLETLAAFYRDVAACALDLSSPRRLEHEAVTESARDLTAGRAAARVERIHETLDALDWNANPSTTLDSLLYDLASL